MKILSRVLLSILMAAGTSLAASDFYVDTLKGLDSNDGLSEKAPFKTIANALSKAGAGDTVYLSPGQIVKEEIVIKKYKGDPARPLVIDGRGATIYGCGALDKSKWESLGNGLFRHKTLLMDMKANPAFGLFKEGDGLLVRFFFVIDGQMQRMGRKCKGTCKPFKKVEELQVGEWTFVKDESSFVVKLAVDDLSKASIEMPLIMNGVSISGSPNNGITIRNLNVTRVLNDGFNIHGASTALRFENVSSIECGDDGISAHEKCEFVLDRFYASKNATGICNIGSSVCDMSNLYLDGNIGFELYSMESAVFRLKDSYIDATVTENPIRVIGDPKKNIFSRMDIENTLFVNRSGASKKALNSASCVLNFKKCSLIGISPEIYGISDVQSSLFAGLADSGVFYGRGANVTADNNLYAVGLMRFEGKEYRPDDFAKYQEISKNDAASVFIGSSDKKEMDSVSSGSSPASWKGRGADISNVELKKKME